MQLLTLLGLLGALLGAPVGQVLAGQGWQQT